MPIYTVKAHDGKTLTIEAPDEAALDEAMSDYEAENPVAPGAFSQGTLGGRALRGAAPVALIDAFGEGVPADQRAALLAGGIGQAAGTAASYLAGGPAGAAVNTALGAAVGAAQPYLEPAARAGGSFMRRQFEKAASPITEHIPEDSPSVALNFIKGTPGVIGESIGELAPMAPLMLFSKGASKITGAPPSPNIVPPAAAALESAGGRLTPAMRASSVAGRKVLGGIETAGRSNPFAAGVYANIDEANAAAIRELAQRSFGRGVLEPGAAPATGEALGAAAKEFSKARAAGYKPITERLEKASGAVPGLTMEGPGSVQPGTIGLSPDFKSQIMSRLKSSKDIAKPNLKAFGDAIDDLFEPGMDPQQVETAMQNLKTQFAGKLKGADVPGGMNRAGWEFDQMLGAAKDAYYEGLDAVSPGLGEQLKAYKGDYAEASQAIKPMTKALQAMRGKPEKIGQALLGSGSDAIKSTLAWGDKNAPEVANNIRRNLAREILHESGGSTSSLVSKLKTYKEIIPLLGEEGAALKNLAEASILAGQETLGTKNPSGSGGWLGATAHVGSLASGIGPLAGKTALDFGYLYGVGPLQRLARAAREGVYQPGISAALGKANIAAQAGAFQGARSRSPEGFQEARKEGIMNEARKERALRQAEALRAQINQ